MERISQIHRTDGSTGIDSAGSVSELQYDVRPCAVGDEAFSANTAHKDVDGILQVLYYWDNHPPLYYYWLKLFGTLFGYKVPVFHLASLVPFVIGIVLALTVVRKHFGLLPATFL